MYLLLLLFIPFFAHAHPPINFPYEWQISADTEFLQTTSNYSTTGSTYTLPLNGQLVNVTSKFNLTYHWSPKLHLYGGADYAYTKSSISNIERTTGGLPYIRIGSRYYLNLKKYQLIPVVDANISMRKVEAGYDDALISDGVSKFTLGLWGLTKWKKFTPYTFLGFTYCTDEFASPFVAKLGTSLDVDAFSFFTEVAYTATMIEDKYVNNPNVRLNVVNAVNGGSYRFYSVNPVHTDFGAGFTYTFNSEWNAEFRLDYAFQGQRYSEGMTGMFRIAWNLGETDADREVISKPGLKKKPKNEGKFRDKLEDDDQDLFE